MGDCPQKQINSAKTTTKISNLIMISQNEMLGIICTEAVEYGGLQEIPGQQYGGKTSFHSAKRTARHTLHSRATRIQPDSKSVKYGLMLIRNRDGTLEWKD